MRHKSSMMQPTNFTDFNPLDVLAAAASLQRRTGEEQDDGENEKTGSDEVEGEAQDEGAEDDDGGPDKSLNCEIISLTGQKQDEDNVETGVAAVVSAEQEQQLQGSIIAKPPARSNITEVANKTTASVLIKAPAVLSATCEANIKKTIPITPPPVHRIIGGSGCVARSLLTDHSYAFVTQLQSLKAEEDEGYSSRSSLDDDSEETVSRLNHKNGQYLTGWGIPRTASSLIGGSMVAKVTTTTDSAATNQQQHKSGDAELETPSTDTSRKGAPTKIVILSKDSKLQRIISGINNDSSSSTTASAGGSSLMLRTLLGQKAAALKTASTTCGAASQGQSKVIIAGGLSGRVINVLKSGSISLAPPEGLGPQEQPQQQEESTLEQVTLPTLPDTGDLQQSQHTTLQDSDNNVTQTESVRTGTEAAECQLSNCDTTEPQAVHEPSTTEEESTESDNIQQAEPTSETSSRQGGTLSEDETSCDSSSKDYVTVDTTPVMSPSADLSSPLMSPVCERDVPMMSPMVGSPESMCDIFKLPSCISRNSEKMIDTAIITEEQCDPKLELNCGINDDSVEPADVTSAHGVEGMPEDEQPPTVAREQGTDESLHQQQDLLLQQQPELDQHRQHTEDVANVENEGASLTNFTVESSTTTTNTITAQQQQMVIESDSCSTGISIPELQQQLQKMEEPDSREEVQNAKGEPQQMQKESDSVLHGVESIAPPTDNAPTQAETDSPMDVDPPAAEELKDVHKLGVDLPVVSFSSEQQQVQQKAASDLTSSAHNQYIIEDDESPVAKFGTPRSSADEDMGPSSEASSPLAVAITAAPTVQKLDSDLRASPGKSTALHSEPVQILMTTEPIGSGTKSVFTSVRRPLVSGVKALTPAGSLHMIPVVPASGAKTGVMHVVPVSGARGVVTQIIPKPGVHGQFITGVPVLSGKTVVLPDNSKGRMNTILVPVSVAGGSAPTAPISLVQTSKSKLSNLQPKAVDPEPTQRAELSSPLLFHHGRITPVSVTSDNTSELLSSPESSLHGGFSGVIMNGRATPDKYDTPRPSSRTSLENSKDKISLKISSNSVMESDDSMSSETGFPSAAKKETIGIGMMGSLSWKNIESSSPRGLTPIGTGGSGREFVRIQGGELRTVSDEDSMPALEKSVTAKRPGRLPKSQDGKAANRKRSKCLTSPEVGSTASSPPPTVTDQYGPSVAQLHPLIDHDYCMFTEFNAQIQSSIIATTESKTKIEKKYAKKTKAVRTKAVRGLITEESLKGVSKGSVEKMINKGRRGRLKKRQASKDKAITDEELSLDGSEEQLEDILMAAVAVEEKPRKAVSELKPSRTSERRAKLQAMKDDKNYVKITGSYQEEFVYFATKTKRNRPRKSLDDPNSELTKKQQVGGIAVFDWYKDMSKTADKTSRFGTPTTSGPSSPVPAFMLQQNTAEGVTASKPGTPTLHSTPAVPTTSASTLNTTTFRPGGALTHESEVADLVCDLAEINSLGSTVVETTVPAGIDMDLSSFSDSTATEGAIPPVSVNDMAEQVREMLNSMGADELENLDLKFDVDPSTTGLTDASFDGLLGGFTEEVVAPAAQTTNNLCDLDEINDSDLLQSDLGISIASMPTADTLKTSASAPSLLLEGQHTERLPPPADNATFGFSKTLEFADMKLDKTELFPDMAPPPAPVVANSPATADVSTVAANTAPELTLVSMYWNDLPGLVLCGQQYVRLVDIHKQVLPAKDTGILKKRCQMMGLSIANCSELQRDFLVRYANAAKSKSTVIVSKEAAQTLIGFYVEPKSRPSKQSLEERGIQLAEQARAQASAAAAAKSGGGESTTSAPTERHRPSSAQSSPAPSNTPIGRKNSVSSKTSSSVGSPSPSAAAAAIRRKRRLTSTGSDGSPSPASGDVKRSARLKHKTVSYSDMLLGNHYEIQEALRKEEEMIAASAANTVIIAGMNHKNQQQSVVAEQLHQQERQQQQHIEASMSEDSQENKDTDRMIFPEDIEIKKLKTKMRLKNLNPKEKRRLRRLREKVRKREIKRKLRERRKIDRMNGRKKANVMATAIANIVKSKKKLQETHMFNKKYNQEHCYAAAPVSPDKKDQSQTHAPGTGKAAQMSIDEDRIAVQVEEELDTSSDTTEIATEADTDVDLDVSGSSDDSTVEVIQVQPEPVPEQVKVVLAVAKTVKSRESSLSVSARPKPTISIGTKTTSLVAKDISKKEVQQQTSSTSQTTKTPVVKSETSLSTKPSATIVKAPVQHSPRVVQRPPVAVIHRDAVQRLSQRSRWQDGTLYVGRFTDQHAACISCTTCGEYLSVKRFMKHMHHQNNKDELAHVTLSQTLELKSADSATEEERSVWAHFEKLREKLIGSGSNGGSSSTTPRRVRIPSVSPSNSNNNNNRQGNNRSSAVSTTGNKNNVGARRQSPVTIVGKNGTKLDKNSPAAVARAVVKAVTAAAAVVNNGNGVLSLQQRGGAVKPGSTPASAPPKVRDSGAVSVVTSSAPPTPNNYKVTTTSTHTKVTSPQQRTVTTPGRRVVTTPGSKSRTGVAVNHIVTKSGETVVAPVRAANGTQAHNTTPRRSAYVSPSPSPSTPLVRQSTRVRKQKQLHPIERYVFSNNSGTSPPATEPPAKRPRLSEREPVLSLLASAAKNGSLTSSTTTSSSGRKVRLRLSTGGTTAKYDLRASPPENARQ